MRLTYTSQANPVLQPASSRGQRRGRAVSDLAIARAVAGAVRGVPGVSGLSRGFSVMAATYGPMQRVTGVVVDCRSGTADAESPEGFSYPTRIEVHVIVQLPSATSLLTAQEAAGDVPGLQVTAEDRAGGSGLLLGVAVRIRRSVQGAVEDMGLPTPAEVDVYIDDID